MKKISALTKLITALLLSLEFVQANDIYVPLGGTIYRVDTNGTASVFVSGLSNGATGVAFARSGHLYAKSGAGAIHRIDTNGVVSTFVQSSLLSGGGALAFDSKGNLYVGNDGNRNVLKITPDGNVSEFAPSTMFTTETPFFAGLACDSSDSVYISTWNDHSILKIDTNGISSVFYQGDESFAASGLAIDASGNLYAASFTSARILKITPRGEVSTLAAGAGLLGTWGLTIDQNNTIFAANYPWQANNTIIQVTHAGEPSTYVSRLGGNGGGLTYLAAAPAVADTDGDGSNDYREGKDGTDPNDPDSFNPLSTGLVAYFPFTESPEDESGYARSVEFGNIQLAPGAGNDRSSYYFTGDATSYHLVSGIPIPSDNAYTWSTWIKPEILKPRNFLLSRVAGFGLGESTPWLEILDNGQLRFARSTVTEGELDQFRLSSGDSRVTVNQWAHLVAVSDTNGVRRIFVNGVPVAGGTDIEYGEGLPFFLIGADRFLSANQNFQGHLGSVRVYSRALSEAEIGQLYEAEAAGLDSDNDGVTDYRERRDGTNPLDSSSFEALSKNLVAHYPFDGSTLDESGYANHAVNKGATDSADRFGAASSAYDFNGVDAYLDAPPLVSDYQRNFTMSGWIKTTHVSSDRLDAAVSALSKTRDAGDFGGPAIDFREGKAIFTFNNNRVYGDLVPFEEWEYVTPDLLADGNWRHYIMSIDADGLITAFINGQPVASHQIDTFLEVNGASPFQIGRAGGLHAAARYFPGQIDEVRVYNRGLTAEEAAMLYRESVCGLDSDADGVTDYREKRDETDPHDVASFEPFSVALIANYPFDNSWKDESGYCRDVLAPYTTFEPGLSGQSLGLAEGNSQANYWNDPNNIESPGRINNFTFSVWMKPATLEQADGAWYHLVSAPNNAAYLRIGNAVGTPGAKVLGMGYSWSGIPGFDYSTPAVTSLQESYWQHVVGVQQGISTAIYINGRPVGSLVEGQEILFDPENFTIGNLFNKDTFQGLIDEVRIYGRALSPAEVGALYALEVGDLDSDNDGLDDVHETNTGAFVSATDAGTDPYNPDTSGDGILDGEAVLWNFNPLTDHSQVLAFLRHATGVQSGRFALYTESSIMDLNLGGVMLQKSGNQASVRFKVESKMDLRDPAWTDRGTYLLPPIDMPGSKGFLRIRAEQP
jgi:sugar lactone lactonase YvrE